MQPMSNVSETAYIGSIYTVGPRKTSLLSIPVCVQILTYCTWRRGVGTQHLPLISSGGKQVHKDKQGDAVCSNKLPFSEQLRNKTVAFTIEYTFLPSGYPNCSPFKNFLRYSANVINVGITTELISQHMVTISQPQKWSK